MYVGMFWRPIMNLSSFYNTLITNFSAADRIFDILDVKPIIKNSKMQRKLVRFMEMLNLKMLTFLMMKILKFLKM